MTNQESVMVPSRGTIGVAIAMTRGRSLRSVIRSVAAAFAPFVVVAAPVKALQVHGGANRPPKIEISLPDRSSLYAGEKLRFTVTITDPDGDPVDARLVKGLGRMTMRRVHHEHSPAKRMIEWWPQSSDAGRQRIVFEANDTVHPARKVRKAVVLDVGNMNGPNSGVVVADVDGDGRNELLATSRFATQGGVTGAGVVYRFDDVAATGSPIRTPSVRYDSTSATTQGFGGGAGQSVLPWDFTGDGRPELTIAATLEDQARGRIFSFDPTSSSGSPTPLATLSDAAGRPGDELGRSWSSRGMYVGDVTGDGIDDLVVAASNRSTTHVQYAGAVFVFAGGPRWNGARYATATLLAPVAHVDDQLSAGTFYEDTIVLEDVTGDGVLDVIVEAPWYDAKQQDEGAVFVWEGGPSLVHTPAPRATLTIAGASPGDLLSWFGHAQGLRAADVTGDGVKDVIVGEELADDGAKADTGAIFVWAGGATLAGTPAPTATLRDSAAKGQERLGEIGAVDSLFLVDLSGDGILDLVSGSPVADGGGVGQAGQLYVWNGGATLSGSVDPTARLFVQGAHPFDQLGWLGNSSLEFPTIRFAEVTGDGRLDVVASAPLADTNGVQDAGAVYVWKGRAGGFAGATANDAALTLATPRRRDLLGDFGDGPGFDFADLNGDGQLDVVVGSQYRGDGGKGGVGVACLFLGGAGLSGARTPDAELFDSQGFVNDFLASTTTSFADLNGDGITDAIFVSPNATSSPFGRTGAAYVWFGGVALVGSRDPDVRLRAPQAVGTAGFAADLQFADLTGDDVDDVLIGSPAADVNGVVDAGGWWLFAGGVAMGGAPAPVGSLLAPYAHANDRLGDAGTASGCRLLDFDQDGALDVLAVAPDADTPANADAGALYLWRGPFTNGAGTATSFYERGPTTSFQLGQ